MTNPPDFATFRSIVEHLATITPAELAELLKVSRATLASWRRRKRGPEWIAVGHSVRYPVEGVNAWLTQRERRPIT